jgi:transposase
MIQTDKKVEGRIIIGADVAKASIVFKLLQDGRPVCAGVQTIANKAADITKALIDLGQIDLIVCEVTGGYERRLLEAANKLGVPIHRADGARVKAFITSFGVRAKTDAIDAYGLALYGQDRFKSLLRWTPPDPKREELQSLVKHRQALLDQRTVATNRSKAPNCRYIAELLQAEISFINTQVDAVERRISNLMKSDAAIKAQEKCLRAIKGIGPVSAHTLIAMLPELGRATRKQIACLAGLAPHPAQSGNSFKKYPMTGGRDLIRRVLFMAALTASRCHPDLKHFYQNLLDNRKPKKLALAAVARKLVTIANAVLKPNPAAAAQLT